MPTSTLVTLRQELRHYLTTLEAKQRDQLTQAAIENFLHTPEYTSSREIAAFYPVRHELNLMPLIETCWSDNKKVYLPCLSPKPSRKMSFLPFTSKTPMKINRYHIPEPSLPIDQRISIFKLDVVITPLLAFGPQGQRLGMGGGYYDRAFAFQNQATNDLQPRLWGIALEAQARNLAANPWDVNIHGVATEETIYRYD